MIISKLICERCCNDATPPVFITLKERIKDNEFNKDVILCLACRDKMRRHFYLGETERGQ